MFQRFLLKNNKASILLWPVACLLWSFFIPLIHRFSLWFKNHNPSYLCLHAGFFTCSFHIAFFVTHLPGKVTLSGHSASVSAASLGIIGLFNIAGSLFAGSLGHDIG